MVVEPRKTVTWDEFKNYPPFSIALDGYCSGRPRCRHDGYVLNMNHHEGVDALATRSTCEQALCHVKLGLFDVFRKDDIPTATLYLNDPDQDSALATFILMHPEYTSRPKLQALVDLEDHMDMSAGLYPPSRCDMGLLRRLVWIQDPYMQARLDGTLFSMDGDAMHALISDIHYRIKATLFGRGKEQCLDTRFETIADHGSWRMIKEIGTQARTGMAEEGVRAYAIVKSSRPDGCRDYSVGRISAIQPFPLKAIFSALNAAEGIGPKEIDRWGGSRIIGGSPRSRGSGLSPSQVGEVINACLPPRPARK
jgi:hypothetical protein